MESFHFKFCLCGRSCPSVQEFDKYCLEIDGQHYFATNKQLIPIIIVKKIYNEHAKININNVVNFFKYVVDKNLFTIFNNFNGAINSYCCLFKYTTRMSKFLSSNNMVDILKFFFENPKYYYPRMLYLFFFDICYLSDIKAIKSFIKYLPMSYINSCLFHGLIKFNKQMIECLLSKYKKYATYFLLGKKSKLNLLHTDEKNFIFLNLELIFEFLFVKKFNHEKIKIYEYILDQFSQLENDLSEINFKNDKMETYNYLISSLQYDNKIASDLLKRSITYKQDKNMSLTRKLILDVSDINYLYDDIIFTIITNQNLNLLDILYVNKLLRQCDLDYILTNSCESKLTFVQEIINYGANIDTYYDKLLKNARKYENTKLVDFLENYYNN
ncbi:hypothetical protein ma839 [Moumouvirus australiensis]|uniref:Uncharacterized protein n=1 Tax=Moumouvirus australiensis TaxID=2109587 RepID=A0A2P1EMU1_9VIRU|nr:hypothetical protein QKC55_gp065 [Moumouvirus australiensis]AVL95226.1 hypothetical protein ma839 [Moumouvirus australiensis]